MADGRAHVFPQALLFGARTVSVPRRGNTLCASLGLPFRLDDGRPVSPNDYYAAVSKSVGKDAIPDSMAPLPGAEMLVLGTIAPVETSRRARVRCGEIVCRLRLEASPDALPGMFLAAPEDAVWHREDNPVGRGGGEDTRQPLILREGDRAMPVWLGATPFAHPARTRLAGVSEHLGADGWPVDADPAVLYDAHPAFRTRSLHAGDPLEIEGLGNADVQLVLPPYRAAMATSRKPAGKWFAETVRIHTVVAIPSAGIGAIFWRAAVELGDDILGEGIVAVVAALEDVDAAPKDAEDLGIIAAERWLDPVRAQDDRPLLPRAMAPLGAPPPAPDATASDARHAAAEEWAEKEFGVGVDNPFAAPDVVSETDAALDEALDVEDGRAPDIDQLDRIGSAAVAASRARHAEAGFDQPDAEAPRPPVSRGTRLDAEARTRLREPYQAPRERALAATLRDAPPEANADPQGMLTRLGDARLIAAEPVLSWPAFEPAEAERFGESVLATLSREDPPRHIDVSGAIIGISPGDLARGALASALPLVAGRRFEGLLAEETVWRSIEFADCTFADTTFAKGRMENCVFRDCVLEQANLSGAYLTDLTFTGCTLRRLSIHGASCVNLRFENCVLEEVAFVDLAIRDSLFEGGTWRQVEFTDSLLVRVAMRGTAMSEVTYSQSHGPECRFEELRMHKVWVMGLGFAESVFQGVEAETCGFLGNAHFQRNRFQRCRFRLTGFGNAKFHDTEFGASCVFDRCDLTGAEFVRSKMPGIRFLECTMPMSVWLEVDANDAWFMDSVMRGVDFGDTSLLNAVFASADLTGTRFNERLTVGADFRGTVLA